MKTLAEIYDGLKLLTDKGTIHSYIRIYEGLLVRYRAAPVVIVEVGVESGGSIALWSRYFEHPESRIIGIDIIDKRVNLPEWGADNRLSFIKGSICDPTTTALIDCADIVIDDASHAVSDQMAAFQILYPRLRPGGLYVIEDIQSNASCERLMQMYSFVKVDLRGGRYDDVLLIAYK